MLKSRKIVATVTALVIANPLPTAMLTIAAVTLPNVVAPQPAAAAWWDGVTGVYINMFGKKYYFGDYVHRPEPIFWGGTWEIRSGNRIVAHGYNKTINPIVWWVASRLPR